MANNSQNDPLDMMGGGGTQAPGVPPQNLQTAQASSPPVQPPKPSDLSNAPAPTPQPVAAPIAGGAQPQLSPEQIAANNPIAQQQTNQAIINEQAVAQPPVQPRSRRMNPLLSLVILFFFFALVGVGGFLAYENLIEEEAEEDTVSINDQDDTTQEQGVVGSVEITSPATNEIVAFPFVVVGTQTDAAEFSVLLYSSADELLDQVSLSPTTDAWSATLQSTIEINTEGGYLLVTDSNNVEYDRVTILFDENEVTSAELNDDAENNVSGSEAVITNPSIGGVLESPLLVVEGQVRNIFEGSVVVRVLDSEGNTVYEDITTAQGDAIGTFVPFSLPVVIPSESFVDNALLTFQIIEISALDGSEAVLDEVEVFVSI